MSRYIDADLMKENHLMSDDCNNCEQNPRECQYNYIYTKMDFCEWIDDEPTADVVEVKHGEWIPIKDDEHWYVLRWECSCCGFWTTSDKMANYCEDCGAKMGRRIDE